MWRSIAAELLCNHLNGYSTKGYTRAVLSNNRLATCKAAQFGPYTCSPSRSVGYLGDEQVSDAPGRGAGRERKRKLSLRAAAERRATKGPLEQRESAVNNSIEFPFVAQVTTAAVTCDYLFMKELLYLLLLLLLLLCVAAHCCVATDDDDDRRAPSELAR